MLKKRLILIIALILGLLSSVTVYKYLEAQESGSVVQEMVPVVVAVKVIEPKERITIDKLTVKKFPREMVHFEAAASVEEVVGFFARDQLLEGEQILRPKLIKGFEDYGIVIKIPTGHRAMTIPVDSVVGVAGFIRPGDYIDVIAGFNEHIMGENIARVILQKVLVLATDQDLSEDNREPVEGKTVTVAVSLEDAEKLAFALDNGVVRVTLRPLESSSIEPIVELKAKELQINAKPAAPKPAEKKEPLSKLATPPKVQPKNVQAEKATGPYTVEVIHGVERSTVTVDAEKTGVNR